MARQFRCFTIRATALLLAACGSTQVTTTLQDPSFVRASFRNVLVIAVASDYDARAQFERQMVSGIRASGASATAYYTIVGRNPPVTRNDVSNAVRARNFDAVLFTRVKGQIINRVDVKTGTSQAKTTRKDGGVVNLFRYDYAVLNEPDTVETSTDVTLVTELYAAADETKVWAIESVSTNQKDVSELIDNQVGAIVGQLRKDGMIGP